MSTEKIHTSFKALKNYCEDAAFKGYDPYDGLNSKLFKHTPLLPKIRFIRLAWIQFFKRSPINFRKLVGIKPEYNPKAMGLFLAAYCELYQHDKKEAYLNKINFFLKKIEECQTQGFSGACWGYNFDWESRAFFQPKFTPTIVPSCFIANALLDAYEITKDPKLLSTARSTCDFLLKDLNRTKGENDSFAFSYSPLDNSVVYNASLLGARLLARVYSISNEKELIEASKQVVTYCCNCQQADGSWAYSPLPFHKWIDSFHTGYNLECISDYMKFSGDESFKDSLSKGFDYYINTFFTTEGVPRCFSDSTYPIDIHSASQLAITLKKCDKLDEYKVVVDNVLSWTIDHMQSKKGYFFYKLHKKYSIKIPYMRWSQAWMFISFCVYLNHFIKESETI